MTHPRELTNYVKNGLFDDLVKTGGPDQVDCALLRADHKRVRSSQFSLLRQQPNMLLIQCHASNLNFAILKKTSSHAYADSNASISSSS